MSFIHHFTRSSRRHRIGSGKNTLTFQHTNGVGDTFDPTITLAAGCPHTPLWDLGNGDTTTGLAVSYNSYADAGPHTVTLTIPDIDVWLTSIDVRVDKIIGDLLAALAHCQALTTITLGENTGLVSNLSSIVGLTNLETLHFREHQTSLTGDIALLTSFPNLTSFYSAGNDTYGDVASIASMTQLTYLDIHAATATGPGSVGIYGDVADLDTLVNLIYLAIGATNLTGDIADLAPIAGLRSLLAYNLPAITGLVSALPSTLTFCQLNAAPALTLDSFPFEKLQYLYVHNNALSQAEVDAILLQIYTDRMFYTSTTPTITLLIHGDNAAPSGILQDATPPTTGKEYIYKLVNDPDVEGFKKWTITYS